MKKRRRSYSQRKTREGARDFLSTNWRLLTGVSLFLMLLAAALAVWDIMIVGGSQGVFLAGFTTGAMVVAAAAMVTGAWLLYGDSYTYVLGNEGEQATREVLARAVKSGQIFGWVDNIELDGRDIDHVVIAPQGVLAIETKLWKAVGVDNVGVWISQAAANARKSKSILLSSEIKSRPDVQPLVVVWGSAVGLEDAGGEDFGESVIKGKMLEGWLADRADGELPRQQGLELLQKLEEFASKHAVS